MSKKAVKNSWWKTRREVVRLHKEGKKPPEIAKLIKRSPVIVYHHLRRAEESGEIRKRKKVTSDVMAIVSALIKGRSYAAVAEEHDVTRSYVSLIAKNAREKGIVIPKRRPGRIRKAA